MSSNPPPSSNSPSDADMQVALKGLLQLAGMTHGQSAIMPQEVNQAVEKLKSLILQLSQGGSGSGSGKGAAAAGAAKAVKASDSNNSEAAEDGGAITSLGKSIGIVAKHGDHPYVLLAGQLGIITHQLKQSLVKLGAQVNIARDVEEAIAEYQRRDYSLVIIDLYMPTEREGLIVLDEIKKLSLVCNISTQLIILAPPSKDKTLRDKCMNHGAACFLEKAEGWHKSIVEYYQTGEVVNTKL